MKMDVTQVVKELEFADKHLQDIASHFKEFLAVAEDYQLDSTRQKLDDFLTAHAAITAQLNLVRRMLRSVEILSYPVD